MKGLEFLVSWGPGTVYHNDRHRRRRVCTIETLRDVLQGDAKDRCVYYAINAVTRLTKKDLRAKPVEEMDIEETRRKALDMLGRGSGNF